MIEIFLAIIIGIGFGIITGLIPGIHINLISILIISMSAFLLNYTTPLILTIIILSMAITHTFLDSIPSIFLGAPDDTTVLSVLPGHKMLLKGHGYQAVALTIIGSLFSLLLAIILVPIIIPTVSVVYPIIKEYIAYILVAISLLLILRESKSKSWAFIIFILSGILGLATLTLPNLKQPLFPMLSGLFGTSMLFLSYYTNVNIPKQKIEFPQIEVKDGCKALGSTIFSGSITSFLPGIGPAQAAILGSQITKLSNNGFLILVGGLNTVNMVLSFVALYALDKARNGAVVTISKILSTFTLNHLILFLGCSLVVAGIATYLSLNLSKVFSSVITKINYKKLCLGIISLITILVIILSGFYGLLILITATFIGIIPTLKGIGKNHLMGCLLIPVILHFIL